MSINEQVLQVQAKLTGQKIIAATKTVGCDEIRILTNAGVWDIGENRVADLIRKQDQLKDLPIRWHFIGSLQSNKVKLVINRIDALHSLDRRSLAEEIQKYREGMPLDCFVEVHIANESTKSGILPTDAFDFIRNLQEYDKIRVIGLMGMATQTNDEDQIGREFMRLRHLRDQISAQHWTYAPCEYLSMGMSNDYRIAIRCGATHLRLGTLLFRNGGL
jgi:hypothetical protein